MKITEISNSRSARNLENSFEDGLENFIKSNELSMEVPSGSTVTFSARNLDNGEIDLKLRMNSGSEVQGNLFH